MEKEEKIKIILFGGASGSDICTNIIENNFKENIILYCNTFSNNVEKSKVISFEESIKLINIDYEYFICTGDNNLRYINYNQIKKFTNKEPINIIHNKSNISNKVNLGYGNLFMANSFVNVNCHIGDCVIINTGAIIEHDCIIGNFSQISPNSTICGYVKINNFCFISAGSTIIPKIVIGENSIVAAGSVVIKDVTSNVMVAGVPSKIKKYINE
jgi:sugar O-acyltransferase (sialic acid O-acetyltransferase NeuD family)